MSSPDEIDGGEGVVEEIDIGALTPSSFYQNNLSKKVIDYTKFVENTWVNLEETSISDLPLLNNSGIADQVEPFCKEFATVERSDIFTNVPNLVADFGGYLCQCVVGKTSYQVAVQWPPLIPKIHPSIPSFLVLLARILKRTDDTFKFYYFMIAGFYQNIWTQKTCLQNQILISVCRCHTGKKEKDSWAIIDRDRNFYLYDIDNKKCVAKTTCQLTKCYSSTDKKTINILDVASRVACKFTPFEKEQIQLWDLIYSRQKVPFPFYFSSAAEVFPDIMYKAFYYTITSNDTIIPHAIMKTDMFYPEIWESLIKCFSYARKYSFLAECVFANTFNDKFEFTNESFDKPSHFLLFARALGKLFFQGFWENFFVKVAAIVDFHDDLDMTDLSLVDPKACEKIVFNVLKYITQGAFAIPDEWRYTMNILRDYLNVRYNSEALTVLGLSMFFGKGILCAFFRENEEFYKGMSVSHPENFPIFAYLLTIPFSLCVYGGNTEKLKGWNKRLESHFFPRWRSFLYNISDWNKEESFQMPEPEQKSLGYAVDALMRNLITPEFHTICKDTVCQYIDQNNRMPTLCGWNLCCLVSRFFVHSYDPSYDKKKKKKKAPVVTKPVNLPQLPIFVASAGGSGGGSGAMRGRVPPAGGINNTGETRRGMGITLPTTAEGDDWDQETDPFRLVDDTKADFFNPGPSKKRSNTRTRNFTYDEPPTTTMELPDLPAASRYNPINYTDSDNNTSDTDASFTPKNAKKSTTKLQKQMGYGKPAPTKPSKMFAFESSLEDMQIDDDEPNSPLNRQIIISKKQEEKKLTSFAQPLPKPPKLPNVPNLPPPNDKKSVASAVSEESDFLRTIGSESEIPDKPLNTQERRKLMKMVPVDPATITNDPTQPKPKLYKRVVH